MLKVFKGNVPFQTTVISLFLTALSYAVGVSAGWVNSINPIEVFAVLTSYASTWLCVVQRRFNYVFGAISSAAYCVLFFQTGLLASTVTNLFLMFWLIYGWVQWGKDTNPRPVTHLKFRWLPAYIGVAVLFYLAVRAAVTAAGGVLAPVDSVILVATVVAQVLLDRKKLETWIVWVIVNVAAIYVYFTSDLFLVGFQYIFFLINTVIGYIAWRKSMAEVEPTPQPENDLDLWEDHGFKDVEK